jgi:uncharacterized protein YcbK (DUF882 family)
MSVLNSRSKSTAHFKQSEFNCRHCGKNIGVHINLLILLEALRYRLGKHSIRVTSGYRCITHNRAVGGGTASQHLKANAADIVVSGVSAAQVYTTASRFNVRGGCGKYIRSGFTHVDCRGFHARWSG